MSLFSWLRFARKKPSPPPPQIEKTFTVQQLLSLLRQQQHLSAFQYRMVENIFTYNTLKVRDIMIPRSKIKAVKIDCDPSAVMEIIHQYQHSRYPVYQEDIDSIVGVFLAKDIITTVTGDPIRIQEKIRPIIKTPESASLDHVLNDFQKSHSHLAIVEDEHGSTSGLITIEDVIEQIIGDIEDEHDQSQISDDFIHNTHNNHYLVNTSIPIALFNNFFSVSIDDSYFDTLGGILAQQFGKIPRKNARCDLAGLSIKVIRSTSRQIKLIEVTQSSPPSISDS